MKINSLAFGLVCGLGLASCTPPVSNGEEDMAAPSVDLAAGGDGGGVKCAPACAGLTSKCNASGHCVGCLADGDCAMGTFCKIVSDAIANCVSGCNGDPNCGNGQKCCNNQCADPMTDARNCGGCGMACSGAHAVASCAAGKCAPGKCDPGWGDCNNDPMDGCEANLHADPNNCTACGAKCAIANAYVGCADGCYSTACKWGFDDCNNNAMDGCETSVLSDPKNCGACGKSCANLPNAMAGCVTGNCVLSQCSAGYADCDKMAGNGCEVTVATDLNNCGTCGNVCPQGNICKGGGCTCPNCNIPNASAKCVNNMCVFDKCNPGFADCDNNTANGCEINLLFDSKNCTACGQACPQGQICNNGVCGTLPAGCMATANVKIAICISDKKVNQYNTAAHCNACTEKGLTNACVDITSCTKWYTNNIIQTLYNVRTGMNCVCQADQGPGCGFGEIMTPNYQAAGNCPTPQDCIQSVNWANCTTGTGAYDAYIFGVCNLP